MIRGLYQAASGMLAAEKINDVVANDLANVNTPGYKEDTGVEQSFNQVLMERIGNPSPLQLNSVQPIGSEASGVVVSQVATIFSNGPLVQTGNPGDMAITGQGFFEVSTPNGLAYTRNGTFSVDGSGDLVTSQGYKVMGQSGPVTGLTAGYFSVLADGTIVANGRNVNKLTVMNFPQGGLRKEGDNLFQAQGQGVAANNPGIKQGFLEQSNVDLSNEMVNMMSAMRSYEANQKVIQTEDSTLEKAANEIAKV